jgi:hypothetical protein
MAPNGILKPETENAWQVWQVIPIVISIRLLLPLPYLLRFLVVVLKKAAILAIVSYSPHKQAKNSMAGCCNNLP